MARTLNHLENQEKTILRIYESIHPILSIARIILSVVVTGCLLAIGFDWIYWLNGIKALLISFGIYGVILFSLDLVQKNIINFWKKQGMNGEILGVAIVDAFAVLLFLSVIVVGIVL